MKKFLICGLFFTLFVYFVNGSDDEERRFRQGNLFPRKLRSCNFICSFKGNKGAYNKTRCYRIPSQNVVVTDCVFKCLRSKGESPDAQTCVCKDGVCIEEATTTVPPATEAPATEAPTTQPPPTEGTTTQKPNTNAPTTTAPTTNAPTTIAPTTNTPNNPPNSRLFGNQGQKGVRGQNSKKGNRNKQKS